MLHLEFARHDGKHVYTVRFGHFITFPNDPKRKRNKCTCWLYEGRLGKGDFTMNDVGIIPADSKLLCIAEATRRPKTSDPKSLGRMVALARVLKWALHNGVLTEQEALEAVPMYDDWIKASRNRTLQQIARQVAPGGLTVSSCGA